MCLIGQFQPVNRLAELHHWTDEYYSFFLALRGQGIVRYSNDHLIHDEVFYTYLCSSSVSTIFYGVYKLGHRNVPPVTKTSVLHLPRVCAHVTL